MSQAFDIERFFEVLGSRGEKAPNIILHPSIDSTSSDLKRRLENGAPIGTVVVAGQQTAGRGRSGRKWVSVAPHNLYFSISLSIQGDLSTIVPLVPLAAGIATSNAVWECAYVRPKLKWPNDLLVEGKKIAGILCEMVASNNNKAALIVGIGINIGEQSFPKEIADVAASIPETADTPLDRAALAAEIRSGLHKWVGRICEGEIGALVSAWEERAESFGRQVRVGEIEGTTKGLSPDGHLIVVKENGEAVCVVGGIVEAISSAND